MTLLETFSARLQEALLAMGAPAWMVERREDEDFVQVRMAFPADLPLTCLDEQKIKVRMHLPKVAMHEGNYFALQLKFSVEKAHEVLFSMRKVHLAKLPGKTVRWSRWRNYSWRPWYRLFVRAGVERCAFLPFMPWWRRIVGMRLRDDAMRNRVAEALSGCWRLLENGVLSSNCDELEPVAETGLSPVKIDEARSRMSESEWALVARPLEVIRNTGYASEGILELYLGMHRRQAADVFDVLRRHQLVAPRKRYDCPAEILVDFGGDALPDMWFAGKSRQEFLATVPEDLREDAARAFPLFVADPSLRTGALARTLNVSYNRAALIRDLFAG